MIYQNNKFEWSDGYSFVPIGFNMLYSAAKSNRYREMAADIDRHSNGYKARKESLPAKTDAEVVRIYGNRWSIECFFKASNSITLH